jgi:lysophospholipase L1-like esterase
METKTKNIITIIIVSVELIIGIFIAINIYQAKIRSKKVKGVAIVDKKLTNQYPKSPLQHYYEPTPDEIIFDSPQWLDYKATYTINHDGLNERFNYSVDKPQNTYRIIAIGDSHTFGHYVNTEDSYPEQLEDKLNLVNQQNIFCYDKTKIEVINLGVLGYDTEHAINRLKLKGLKYKPDLIIWFIKNDDIRQISEKVIPIRDKLKAKRYEEDPTYENNPANLYDSVQQAQKEIWQSMGGINQVIKYNDDLINQLIQGINIPILFITYKNIAPVNTLVNSYVKKYPNIYNFSKLTPKNLDRLPDTHPSKAGYTHLVKELTQYFIDNQNIFCQESP